MNSKSIHDHSIKLHDSENQRIFEIIEKDKGISCSTAIIQLWLSQKPVHKEFKKLAAGIICLIKNFTTNSYSFRLYSTEGKMLWHQELYPNFNYRKVTDKFYYFPAEDCNAGFNFAFADEARKMSKAIDKILIEQREKSNTSLASLPINLPKETVKEPEKPKESLLSRWMSNKSTKKNKISKIEIGGPVNYRHLSHVGVNSSFDRRDNVEDNDSMKAMIEFLQSINMKANKKTIKAADEFIKNNGGYQKFNQTYKHKQSVRAPPSIPSPSQQKNQTAAPVPVPPRPIRNQIPNPPITPNNTNNTGTNVSSSSAAPPPPPPPPINSELTNPNPVKIQPTEIKKPTQIPPVSKEKTFLDSIKAFDSGTLKSSSETRRESLAQAQAGEQDIVDQLQEALFKMRHFIEDDDDDDDEWG